MPDEQKIKPMNDTIFKAMVWLYNFADLVSLTNPAKHLANIPLKEGMAVVDYGCGPGRYTLAVAKLVGPNGKVFAIDSQPLAISIVTKKVAKEGLTNVEAILVDFYETGVQRASIDLVLLIDTLHMISNYDAFFLEIHRILKQGGILFVYPEHMKISRVREIIEGTGLFRIAECKGRDMVVISKTKQ
ncbi:class I SAM-dependent methyltransferase [Candidatus Omnitrophota bacterium]